MSAQTISALLSEAGFEPKTNLLFEKSTPLGVLELQFQPLRRTKYSGEIRYTESAGCRVLLKIDLGIKTRMIITDKRFAHYRIVQFLNRRKGRSLIEIPELNLAAWVHSQAWAEPILMEQDFQSTLNELFSEEQSKRVHQSVTLDPHRFSYTQRMGVVDAQRIVDTVPHFLVLCELLKNAPAPTEELSLTPFEQIALKNPYLIAFAFIAAVLVALLLLGILFVVLIYLIFGYKNSP